jgi:signal peptidase I
MVPTLKIGDRIIVNKLSYRIHGVGRGDIVVFARPPGEAAICSPPPVNDLVKRVIGLPGETISLSGGQVFINGHELAEPWLPAGTQTLPGPGDVPYSLSQPFRIPQGDYFVMGDNRTESCDSRYWGPIPRSLIVGKVDLRIWPISRIAWF